MQTADAFATTWGEVRLRQRQDATAAQVRMSKSDTSAGAQAHRA